MQTKVEIGVAHPRSMHWPRSPDNCQKWSDVSNDSVDDDSLLNGADDMQTAVGLLAFIYDLVVALTVMALINLMEREHDKVLRVAQSVTYFLIFIFFISMWGTTNNNYFTSTICNHNSAYGGPGYVFSVLMTLICIRMAVFLVYPIMGCIGKGEMGESFSHQAYDL